MRYAGAAEINLFIITSTSGWRGDTSQDKGSDYHLNSASAQSDHSRCGNTSDQNRGQNAATTARVHRRIRGCDTKVLNILCVMTCQKPGILVKLIVLLA